MLALSDAMELRAAGYTGFRVPTLNELYRPFRVGADATAANGALGGYSGLDGPETKRYLLALEARTLQQASSSPDPGKSP